MGVIHIKGIRLYAYHGCLDEEAVIGGNYVVDVKIETDFSEAERTDDLTKTVDYVSVYAIVKQQMMIRSKLIEHVAARIGGELIRKLPLITKARVTVCKLNPPMNGDVKEVCVIAVSER